MCLEVIAGVKGGLTHDKNTKLTYNEVFFLGGKAFNYYVYNFEKRSLLTVYTANELICYGLD